MPDFSSGKIEISLCTGYGPAKMMMEMPGMKGGNSDSDHHGKNEMPCGFSGLSTPSLAGADPIQLTLALVFILVSALYSTLRLIFGRAERLRPPLRGPPFTA